jgi:hypothetical protein
VKTLLLFLAASLTLLLAFRGLSSPRLAAPAAARIAACILVVFAMVLGVVWFDCGRWATLIVAGAVALGSIGIQGEGLARMEQALGRFRFPLFLLSVLTLTELVYLFVPTTTFLTSPGELAVHLEYLLTVNLRDAMVVVYCSAALFAVLPTPRMRTALTLLALGGVGLALFYSSLLPFGFPMMTGLEFEKIPIPPAERLLRAAIDVAIAIAVGLALWRALLRFAARPFVVALLLANISLAVAARVTSTRDQVGGAGGPSQSNSPPAKPLRFSPSQPNVLIVFLDRFMGGFVEPILAEDPQLAARLSGFTWFPRTVSPGENSIAGVHAMLGGYDYTPSEMNARGKPLIDLSTEAFTILPYNFSRHGYDVNIVNPGGLGFTLEGDCSLLAMEGVTCTHISPAVVKERAEEMGFPLLKISESSYADLLVLLATMRSAPYLLKEVIYERGPWRPFMDHSAGTTFRVWAQLKALPELAFTSAIEPNLNIVSSILPHEPYFLDEQCQPQNQPFTLPLDEIRRRGHRTLRSLQHAIAARCALTMTADFFDFLRSEGVYDNSKIVIVSDHGIVGEVEDRSSRAVAGGTTANPYVRMRSVLFVKEIGARGPLQVSEEFLPNAEVPRIVCAQIGGCVNPFLGNRTIEAHGRNDPFFISIVPWQFSEQHPNAFVIKTQLVLQGKDPYDSSGWAQVK